MKYAEDGSEYCRRLKRKYDKIVETGEDDDPPTPMEEPSELSAFVHNSSRSNANDEDAMLIELVDSYKAKNPGRMQWQKCWQKGVQEGRIITYGNGNSLKRKYNKLKKAATSTAKRLP